MDAHKSCGKVVEGRTPLVRECGIYDEKWDASEEAVKKIDECDAEAFGALESSESAIAILGDRCYQRRRDRKDLG